MVSCNQNGYTVASLVTRVPYRGVVLDDMAVAVADDGATAERPSLTF